MGIIDVIVVVDGGTNVVGDSLSSKGLATVQSSVGHLIKRSRHSGLFYLVAAYHKGNCTGLTLCQFFFIKIKLILL